MFYSYIFIVSLLLLATINQSVALQCYKCGCFVIPGETTCLEENELQCVIQYVEDSYCYITRTPGDIEFGHNPNSALIFMESLHYIRATELISYSESTSSWEAPTVTTVSYGCDWNLCNTPRILNLLPSGLTYAVDSTLLTNTLIAGSGEPLTSCLSCTTCINSTDETNCPTPACSGTCFIDDHFDDPGFNTDACLFAFESICIDVKLNTSVELIGTYYIDDKLFEITEIDIYCQKNNCNHPASVQLIQKNTTFSTQISDQLYFRPTTVSTTPSPNNGQFACYKCHCEQEVGSDNCTRLECTIEYQNASYCEIVRDFKTFPGYEHITLGHVQRSVVPYKHFIHAEEELILYKNLTWHPPSVSMISYICDWELCNDGRIVDKLTTSFQFNAEPWEIAEYLHGSDPLETCLGCSICTNSTLDIDQCEKVNCSSTGQCFIDQHIDDPQYDDCEYAFEAMCVPTVSESSIIITATYSIDDDILDFDEVDVYCSSNNCNNVTTVYELIDLISEDIRLDSLFFLRPSENTTVPLNITEPTTSSTSAISNVTTTSQTSTTTTSSSLTSTTTTTTTSTIRTTTTGFSSTTTTTGSSSTTTTTGSSSTTTTTRSSSTTTTTGSSTSSTTGSPNSATILNYSLSYVFLIVFSFFIIIN